MDKTDGILGPQDYAKSKSVRVRNKRRFYDGTPRFGKLPAPKDQYVSRVNRAGVTGGGDAPRGLSLTQYHRRRFLHVVVNYDATPETRLVRNGEIIG